MLFDKEISLNMLLEYFDQVRMRSAKWKFGRTRGTYVSFSPPSNFQNSFILHAICYFFVFKISLLLGFKIKKLGGFVSLITLTSYMFC